MSQKTVTLPPIRTTPELKEKVIRACESLDLKYATVITHLLREWVTGKIELKMELDSDFIASAREAFASDDVQRVLNELADNYGPERTYPNAIKESNGTVLCKSHT